MKASEIRAMTDTEIATAIENAKQKLFNLNFQRVTQNLESTAELGKTRRDIARMFSILVERQKKQAEASEATK